MFSEPKTAQLEAQVIPGSRVTLHAQYGDYTATVLEINHDTRRVHLAYTDFYAQQEREGWFDLSRISAGWPSKPVSIGQALDGDYASGFCYVRGQVDGKFFVEGILTDGSRWYDRVSKLTGLKRADRDVFVKAWDAVVNAKAAVAAEATTAA